MFKAFKRALGLLRMVVSAGSLLLAVIVLVFLWRARQPLVNGLAASTQMLVDTFDTTGKALVVAERALQTTADNVETLQETVVAIAHTLDGVRPAMASVTNLISRNLVDSIQRAKGTLRSAASSARLIDDLLSSLAQIPLLNFKYNPDTPLSVSLNHVAASLESLPPALDSIATDLNKTESNLGQVSDGITALAVEIGHIKAGLVAAKEVVTEYQGKVNRLRHVFETLHARSATIVTLGMVIVTFFAYWLMVAQVREFIAGLSWLRKG